MALEVWEAEGVAGEIWGGFRLGPPLPHLKVGRGLCPNPEDTEGLEKPWAGGTLKPK